MSDDKTPNLDKALLAAQLGVRAVSKDSTNTFSNFNYASNEAIKAEAMRALNAAGLTWVCRRLEFDGDRIRFRYELKHAESGESQGFESEMPVVEGKGKPFDKAALGARTEDNGYTLLCVLGIQRVERGQEIAARDDSQYVPPPPKPKATKAKPKQTKPREDPPPPPDSDIEEKKALWADIRGWRADLDSDIGLSTKAFAEALGIKAGQVANWNPTGMKDLRAAHAALSEADSRRLAAQDDDKPWNKHLGGS